VRNIILIGVSLILLTAGTALAVKPENPGGGKDDLEAALQDEIDARIDADAALQIKIDNLTFYCPEGFTSIESQGRQLGCMQTAEGGTGNWLDAANDCFNCYGGRLPTFQEWYISMSNYSLTDDPTTVEWHEDLIYWNGGFRHYASKGFGDGDRGFRQEDYANVDYRCWIPR